MWDWCWAVYPNATSMKQLIPNNNDDNENNDKG